MLLAAIDRRCLAVTQRVAFAGVVAMLAVAFVTTADVLLRWLANAPIHGLNELVGVGMAVAVAATFPAGASQRVNLTIDLLQNRVSDRVLAWLKVAGSVSLLVFYLLLAWRIGAYALQLQARGARDLRAASDGAVRLGDRRIRGVSALVQVTAVFVSVSYALAGAHHASGWSLGGGRRSGAGHRTGRQGRWPRRARRRPRGDGRRRVVVIGFYQSLGV
jgi:hypothetical protein